MAGDGGHSTSGEREVAGLVREAPPGRLAPGHAPADELRGDHHHFAKVRLGRKQAYEACTLCVDVEPRTVALFGCNGNMKRESGGGGGGVIIMCF